MVKRVVITNYAGESVEYKIEGVDVNHNNGLLITEIEGLGPTGADLVFNKLVSVDGSRYNSGRINERNIVIKACFTYANTIEEARLSSYKFFPLNKILKFEIETDNRKAYTYGYVEKNEPNIFESESDMQISVICESPFFLDSGGELEDMFSNVNPLFEFVYENEGFGLNTEMSSYVYKDYNLVDYKGESEIGFTMILHAIGSVRHPKIYLVRTGEMFDIDTDKIKAITGVDFDEGDDIIITALTTKKTYFYLHEGQMINIFAAMPKDFPWPKLTPGPTNGFAYTAEHGEEYLRIYVKYQPLYEGV